MAAALVSPQGRIDYGMLDHNYGFVLAPKTHVPELVAGAIDEPELARGRRLLRLDPQTNALYSLFRHRRSLVDALPDATMYCKPILGFGPPKTALGGYMVLRMTSSSFTPSAPISLAILSGIPFCLALNAASSSALGS